MTISNVFASRWGRVGVILALAVVAAGAVLVPDAIGAVMVAAPIAVLAKVTAELSSEGVRAANSRRRLQKGVDRHVATISEDVMGLSDRVEHLVQEVDGLTTSFTAAGRRVEGLVSEVDGLRARVTRLKDEMESELHAVRTAVEQHAERHAGDEDVQRLVEQLEAWLDDQRAQMQLAQWGDYGAPEHRHAAALAALRRRLGPDDE